LFGLFAIVAVSSSSMGGAAIAADAPATAGIAIDKDKKAVSIDAKIAPRRLEHLKGELYPIEVVACWPHPKGKKAHETVVTFDVNPSDVHKALEAVGLKPGKPVRGGDVPCTGPKLNIFIEVTNADKTVKRIPIDRVLVDPKTKKPLPKSVEFRFTGSIMSQPDPEKELKVYGADLSGTLIAIYPVTDETVCQTSLTMKEEKFLKLEVLSEALPKEGTPVKLVLQAAN